MINQSTLTNAPIILVSDIPKAEDPIGKAEWGFSSWFLCIFILCVIAYSTKRAVDASEKKEKNR